MSAPFVIKVRHENTLKRFNISSTRDLNIWYLKSKIYDCFKLSPDTYLTLTYIDEDGEAVSLDNDDDLCDAALRQKLKPIRVTVVSNTSTTDTKHTIEQSNILTFSPQAQNDADPQMLTSSKRSSFGLTSTKPLQAQAEDIKYVHEPLVKLSDNLMMALCEFVEYYVKSSLDSPQTLRKGSSKPTTTSKLIPISPTSVDKSTVESPKESDGTRMGVAIHFGVTCDGCRMEPIKGTRFKSKVRVNYDLCTNCFAMMGKEEDYTRIYNSSILNPFIESE